MNSRNLAKKAALGAVTLTAASAAHADLIYPADKYTIISSGISSGGSYDTSTGIRTGGSFIPGAENTSPPPPGFWETTVQYGSYTGGVFNVSPVSSIGGFSTGKDEPIVALNTKPVDYFGTTYDYAKPLDSFSPVGAGEKIGGTSWVSPFIETTDSPYGPHIGEPAKLPLGMGGSSSVFAYTTTFDTNPNNKVIDVATRSYTISGKMQTDDDVLDVVIDYGTPEAQVLTFSQTIENPLYPGAHTGPFQTVGTFSGAFSTTDINNFSHTLTFFISNRYFDRSALDYTATLFDPLITPVPEPGSVAFGVILAGGLFGLMHRARNRRKSA